MSSLWCGAWSQGIPELYKIAFFYMPFISSAFSSLTFVIIMDIKGSQGYDLLI
jgi:hypothetical protein